MEGRADVRLVAYLAYGVLAAPFALLGVAWTGMRHDLGLPVAALVLLAVPLTVGRATGGITAPLWLGRRGPTTTGVAGLTMMAAGTLLWAASGHWAPAVVGATIVGYGGGLIESTWSLVIPIRHGARFTTRLHGSYGAGAVLAPLVLTLLGGADQWAWALVTVAIGATTAAVGTIVVRAHIGTVPSTGSIGPLSVAKEAVVSHRFTVVALTAASIEVTAAQWGPTLLEDRVGLGDTAVGVTTSLFWAAITVVRLLGPTLERARPIVTIALAGTTVAAAAALLLLIDPIAAGALVVLGAGSALLFPALVAHTATRRERATVGVAAVFLAGSAGGTAAPALAGGLVAMTGIGSVAVLLAVFAAGATVSGRRALGRVVRG